MDHLRTFVIILAMPELALGGHEVLAELFAVADLGAAAPELRFQNLSDPLDDLQAEALVARSGARVLRRDVDLDFHCPQFLP